VRNKFAGICYRCGKWCNAGDGHCDKRQGSSWAVQHVTCAIASSKATKTKEKSYVRRQ
jgi:hypothetical protein